MTTFNSELCKKLKNGEINCYFLNENEVLLLKQLLSFVFPDDDFNTFHHYYHSYQIFYADSDDNNYWAVYSFQSDVDFMLECQEDDVFHVKQFYN